ncbi:MAG: ABC transporter permease [Phycisphaerales bacterium]|nr:ABC transporter permease [Phycisphaerales bacterium]
MIFVALKMLIGDRLKYLGLLAGVAFATLLIVQQSSILVGLAHQTGSFIRDTAQGDLWVMDEQVRFSQDSLNLRDTVLQQVRGVAGVRWAVPVYQGFLKARLGDGTRATCILVGIDDATLTGGPPSMVEGSLADLRQDRAVLIDHDAAPQKLRLRNAGGHLRYNDRFDINDHEVRVAGTYRASKSFFWEPVIYTTYSRALSIAPAERKMLTYVLVKTQPGADLAAVARDIHAATGLTARTNEEFAAVTRDYILTETGILVNFGLAVGLGFVIGVLICGQMLYNFTLDSLRYYGSLKAMGATGLTLIIMVLAQVFAVGVLGYGIGIGFGSLLGKLVGNAGLAFMMPWWIPVIAAIAILVICAVAAVLSLTQVLRLEPAIVFRA